MTSSLSGKGIVQWQNVKAANNIPIKKKRSNKKYLKLPEINDPQFPVLENSHDLKTLKSRQKSVKDKT